MIDIDLQDIRIVPAQELNYLEINRVKKVELANKYLTYGLVASAIVVTGALVVMIVQDLKKEQKQQELDS